MPPKNAVHRVGSHSGEGAGEELIEVAQHPAGNGGIVHHEKIAAGNAEPAVDMPLAALGLQGLIALHRTLAAGAAHGQLHGQHGHTHDHQEQQIEKDKDTAAVGAGHIGKLPDVADTDGAAGAHQNEAQSGLEILAFHFKTLLKVYLLRTQECIDLSIIQVFTNFTSPFA